MPKVRKTGILFYITSIFTFLVCFLFVKMGPSLKVRFSKFYGPEPEVDMSTFIKLA